MCTIFHHDLCVRWLAELKVKREVKGEECCAREGVEKGRCEEGRGRGSMWSATRLAGEKRASHEVHAFESDWDSDCVDWLRIAYSAGGREANASGSARESAAAEGVDPGCVDGCRKECESEGGERVVFFQSSNLLNLFFPRNVAAVSKLLIAIGKVEPMGWEGRGAGEPN